MRRPEDSRRPAAPGAAEPRSLVAAVARDHLRCARAGEAGAAPALPAVPRATRRPWSRARRRPAGAASTVELIRSLSRAERTRHQ